MKKGSLLFMIMLLLAGSVFSQKLNFCGYKYKDTGMIRRHLEPQLDFLRISDRDTVIDVGTSSGAYIGALNVIGTFRNAHFILVDIDSNCLNPARVNNMIAYYQNLRNEVFANTFSMVVNTFDSLCLPLNRYKKLLIINTLHEIDDKAKMARQIAAVLQSGGEVIIAELLATQKATMHQGCHKPLMSADEIIDLFTAAGFKFVEKENFQPVEKQKDKHPYYFFKLVKL